MGLQVADDGVDVDEELIDEGHDLAHLDLNELAPALLRDLDERVASHVLKHKHALKKHQKKSTTWFLERLGNSFNQANWDKARTHYLTLTCVGEMSNNF